jgi:hypothetical protein
MEVLTLEIFDSVNDCMFDSRVNGEKELHELQDTVLDFSKQGDHDKCREHNNAHYAETKRCEVSPLIINLVNLISTELRPEVFKLMVELPIRVINDKESISLDRTN